MLRPRPLIGVAGMRSPSVTGLRRSGSVAAEQVLECVYRAGGEPVIVYHGDPAELPARLRVFDAVVLPGGNDLDPACYGASPHPETSNVDPLQDRADIAVTSGCVAAGIPLLAICRGMQVLNVACGGTLVQHLEPSDTDHLDAFHDVELTEGSLVAGVMGATSVSVSSYHHQAVNRRGPRLTVTGRAADGCIEALEHDSAPVLAVQWHPEDNAADARPQQALFDWVVDQARRAAMGGTGAVA